MNVHEGLKQTALRRALGQWAPESISPNDGASWLNFSRPHSYCGEYARSLQLLHPELRTGFHWTPLDESTWEPDPTNAADQPFNDDDSNPWMTGVHHIFLHDDQHAYDMWGKHPLPYTWNDYATAQGAGPDPNDQHRTALDYPANPAQLAGSGGWDLEGHPDHFVPYIQHHGDPTQLS